MFAFKNLQVNIECIISTTQENNFGDRANTKKVISKQFTLGYFFFRFNFSFKLKLDHVYFPLHLKIPSFSHFAHCVVS